MRAQYARVFVSFALAVAAAGCGTSDGDRLAVVGKISIQGQPVDEGTINFSSIDPTGGAFGGALIKSGEFEIPAEQGLEPGTYVVRISSAIPGAPVTEALPGQSGPPLVDRVPPQFNAQSTLQFQVKEGERNTFDFNVP